VEENTGDTFPFNEKPHDHAGFVLDLQPADIDARTRLARLPALTLASQKCRHHRAGSTHFRQVH